MTLEDVVAKIDYEGGYDYFVFGSTFSEVEDEEFHRLRINFVQSYKLLEDYLPLGEES